MVVRFGLRFSLLLALATFCACKPNSDPVPDNKPDPDPVFEEVDLGLSVKWASCNLGASSPSESGTFVAWGELQDKFDFNWENYLLAGGAPNTLTKYCTNGNFGQRDDLITLSVEDDAARVAMGGGWRLPTDAEWDEVVKACRWVAGTVDSVPGYIVTSKIPGFTSASIFLPFAGYAEDCFYYNIGNTGYYWSSSLVETTPSAAYCLSMGSSGHEWEQTPRYMGCLVRPVHE